MICLINAIHLGLQFVEAYLELHLFCFVLFFIAKKRTKPACGQQENHMTVSFVLGFNGVLKLPIELLARMFLDSFHEILKSEIHELQKNKNGE